jgi:hypothetical protein
MRLSTKPLASLSLDLDDKWTYMKTHGDPRWKDHPSYLRIVVPRILSFLAERNLTITFFIVGQDAAIEENRPVLRSIAAAGHEIANHSFHHEPWLHLYKKEEIEREISTAEQWIALATGEKPIGFRGPGFSVSQAVIETLAARGYAYDASTLPTFLGPLARAYYFFTAKLDTTQREQRSLLFGSLKDGLRPLKPHPWPSAAGSVLELPVTTIPILRTPFHLSYLLYLSSYSRSLSAAYLRLAVLLCRLRGVQPSFLLHSLDFAAPEDAPELTFFPGMKLSLEHKLSVADTTIRILRNSCQLTTMSAHVSQFSPVAPQPVLAAGVAKAPSKGGQHG